MPANIGTDGNDSSWRSRAICSQQWRSARRCYKSAAKCLLMVNTSPVQAPDHARRSHTRSICPHTRLTRAPRIRSQTPHGHTRKAHRESARISTLECRMPIARLISKHARPGSSRARWAFCWTEERLASSWASDQRSWQPYTKY